MVGVDKPEVMLTYQSAVVVAALLLIVFLVIVNYQSRDGLAVSRPLR